MARFLTVGAAQMGPVSRNESRAAVVVRLLEMMREAKGRGCDLVVFTECALTPFFPRYWEDDPADCDQWFERELPGPGTNLLFTEAKELGIGFHLGYAELAEENGETRHYNSSVLIGPDGRRIGKYRKIHLPGLKTQEGENPHRSHERRYFDVGNLGFRAWRAFGGVIGMCLGNDRRWPETYRVLGLQGAELIVLGYNTNSDHPDHPELDHLTNFHSLLSMQSGAYQNGCFVVGVAKAGNQEGINQIGRSAIIAPSGEVVTQCTTLGDELVVHRCNLDQTKLYKEHIFNFANHREIEAYSLITKTRGGIPPFEPGQDLEQPLESDVAAPAMSDSKSIEKVFTEQYGYPAQRAQDLAEQAEKANKLAQGTPAEKTPARRSAPRQRPVWKSSADPIQAIRAVLVEEYQYSPSQIEPIVEQAVRALEFPKDKEETRPHKPETVSKPKTQTFAAELLTQAEAEPLAPSAESKPSLTVAEDIGWLPGRFAGNVNRDDRAAATVHRLMHDYRYPPQAAQKIAELAEAAWQHMHSSTEPPSSEPAPTAVHIPEAHSLVDAIDSRKHLTTYFSKSPQEKTFPALSSEDAFHVFSVLTEEYGYSVQSARGIAERANSASRRWKSAAAQVPASTGKPPAKTLSTAEQQPPAIIQTPPRETASLAAEEPGKPAAVPDTAVDPIVAVPCPQCDFQLKIPRSNLALLGRKARCPQCQTKFRLPESV